MKVRRTQSPPLRCPRAIRVPAALALIAAGLAWAQDATDPAAFMKEPKIALVVGINKYPVESMLPQLREAVNDATGLKAELTAQGYKVEMLADEHATRRAILNKLDEILSSVEAGKGTFIFAFSGHGAQNDAREPMLATWEVATNHMEEWLRVVEIQKRIETSPVKRSMMFLDACRDMTLPPDPAVAMKKDIPNIPPRMTLAGLAESKGVRGMFSGGDGKVSAEDPTAGHGYFSNFLIKAVRERRDREGLLRFEDLRDYVKASVRDATDGRQVPDELLAANTGNFYVAGQIARRVAFVAGINHYKYVSQDPDTGGAPKVVSHELQSAVDDASNMQALLKSAKFEVTRVADGIARADLLAQFKQWTAQLRPSDVALFYFAGEGAMQDQEVYALAADVAADPPDIMRAAVRAVTVGRGVKDQLAISNALKMMAERGGGERTGPNILITDMCMYKVSGEYKLKEELTNEPNSLVLFANKPGGLAYEKPSGGVMTLSLMAELQKGSSLLQAIGLIGSQVMQATEFAQTPFPIAHLTDLSIIAAK